MEKQMTATPYYDETENYDDGAAQPLDPDMHNDEPDAEDVEAVMEANAPVDYMIAPTGAEIAEYRSEHGGSMGDARQAVRKRKMLVLARYARNNDDLDALYQVVEAIIEGM